MEMANCRKCKKLFPRITDPICDTCKKGEEEIFNSVKEFLRDNPKSTVGEVAEATGVTAKKIFGYLRDGRIEIAEGAGLFCTQCSTPIRSSQLCQECFAKASKEISNMVAAQSPEPVQIAHERPVENKAAAMRSRR